MNTIKPSAFTIEYSGIINVLTTKCCISKAFQIQEKAQPEIKEYNAIWDTGAMQSVCSKV